MPAPAKSESGALLDPSPSDAKKESHENEDRDNARSACVALLSLVVSIPALIGM